MKLAYVVAIASVLCACKGPSDDQRPVQTGPADSASEPITCKSDADCPRRSCGPCNPGEVVMRESGPAVSCTRNPCTNARSVCSPQHVCAVHPDTRKVEDVHSEECQKLLRDKWGLLCKGKEGTALAKCEDVIDAATVRDDNDACSAARASVLDAS